MHGIYKFQTNKIIILEATKGSSSGTCQLEDIIHCKRSMPLGISSLGPCADAFGISVMTVFCMGVAQLPVMIGLAMHFPPVRVDVYSPLLDVRMDPLTNSSSVVVPTKVVDPSSSAGNVMIQVKCSFPCSCMACMVVGKQSVIIYSITIQTECASFAIKHNLRLGFCRHSTRMPSTYPVSLCCVPLPLHSSWS
jgi:hypothetical protein